MMKLMWTGTFPWTVAVLLFVLLSGATIWAYRRQPVENPWRILLPLLRIAAGLLLLLALLRPVLTQETERVIRGRIPVVLDNSGSMSVTDQYRPAELVRIGWHLALYPREVRNVLFESEEDFLKPFWDQILLLEESALALRGRNVEENERDFRRRVAVLEKDLSISERVLRRALEQVRKSVQDTGYLAASGSPSIDVEGDGLLWQRFHNIRGSSLADLTRHERFPDHPDRTERLGAFATRRDIADNYGSRVIGGLRPPESGEYVFYLCSDDEGQLRLGPSDDPDSAERIVHVKGYTSWGDWSTQSRSIHLEAGREYFVEGLHKEGAGGDHFAVGWKRPDGKVERPIPAGYLFGPDQRRGQDFTAAYARWRALPEEVLTNLGQWHAAVEEVQQTRSWSNAMTMADAVVAAGREWQEQMPEWRYRFRAMQEPADLALAYAGNPAVDQAMAQIRATSRWDLVQTILYHEPHRLLERLARKGEVQLFGLEEPVEAVPPGMETNLAPALASTRLGSVIHQVLQQYEQEPVAGIVIISDGQNNAGMTLQSVRQLASERRIPVVAAGAGAVEPPDDIAIETVLAPETSFQDDRLNVSVVLRRNGFQDRPLTLTVKRGGDVVREVEVPPGEETRLTVDASFEEEMDGLLGYEVEIEPQDGEILERNNRRTFEVQVLEDRIRTLLIDEFPRWETRYVRMMLSRDRRVDLTTLFIGSQEDGRLQADSGYPRSREELFGYQLIFLGDVNPEHFSSEQLQDLHDFVVERGGTIMVMAGDLYMPDRYSGTPLMELLPFHRRTAADRVEETRTDHTYTVRLQATDEGRHESLVQIGRTPEVSEQLWNRLPAMNWVNRTVVTAPAADRLIASEEDDPVLVTAFAGSGKVLYVGSDSFWRWRDRARWRYHHRFWGQIVLWAALGRTTGSDPNVKLMTDRMRYAPGEAVQVRVRLLDDEQIPVERAQASVQVLDEEDAVVRQASLFAVDGVPGEYRAEIHGLPRGRFRLHAEVFEFRDREITAEAQVDVGDIAVGEYVHLSLNEPALEKMADRYAKVYTPAALVEAIEPVEIRETQREDHELWNTFRFLVLVALLLGLEWQLRKRLRLA